MSYCMHLVMKDTVEPPAKLLTLTWPACLIVEKRSQFCQVTKVQIYFLITLVFNYFDEFVDNNFPKLILSIVHIRITLMPTCIQL